MSNQMRKLAGQTMVYGISTVLVRLLNYLLVPYLTRVMGRAQYGVVSHIYAVIPFVLVILTMGLESGYFRFAGRRPARGRSVGYSLRPGGWCRSSPCSFSSWCCCSTGR